MTDLVANRANGSSTNRDNVFAKNEKGEVSHLALQVEGRDIGIANRIK